MSVWRGVGCWVKPRTPKRNAMSLEVLVLQFPFSKSGRDLMYVTAAACHGGQCAASPAEWLWPHAYLYVHTVVAISWWASKSVDVGESVVRVVLDGACKCAHTRTNTLTHTRARGTHPQSGKSAPPFTASMCAKIAELYGTARNSPSIRPKRVAARCPMKVLHRAQCTTRARHRNHRCTAIRVRKRGVRGV